MARAELDGFIDHAARRSMIRTVTNIADELEALNAAQEEDLTPAQIVEWLRVAARILEEDV